MSAAWLVTPGLVAAALTLFLARRIISPTRYVQAVAGLAVAVLVAFAVERSGGLRVG